MNPACILIVEDERIVALHLRQQLAKMGYKVVAHAASGDDALRQIKAYRPDVILMDIHIHGPIDGIETASRIPSDLQVPVIYLTVSSKSETLDRASTTKPYGYLVKPFSERELHATIQMALARRTEDVVARSNERRLERLLDARTVELEMQLAERLVAEQMLRRAQRLESIGHLTSGIAHDFNNLLQVIIGNLALLEKRTSDLANAYLITAALEAAQRGASLTRRLMTFRARQEITAENFDVNYLLGMCSDLISGVTGPLIHVQYQLQATRAVCHLDREAFERVILNLAVNARHAMPDGGTLTIETDTLHVVSAGADEKISVQGITCGLRCTILARA